jgi:hypothetical protein
MESTKPITIKKLHLILHRAFVEARNLALAQNIQQSFDLADTFEVLPSLLDKWDDQQIEYVRSILGNYQSKYGDRAYDYLSLLDMEENTFEELFRLW